MSHKEEVDLIRRRSMSMLKHAEICLSSGDYDLACFLAEQATQLYIKSFILEKLGEMPRTHVIRQLLHMIKELVENEEELEKFVKRNRRLLSALEEAYLATRYLFRIYTREDAEDLISFAKEVIKFVSNLKIKA